MSIFNSTVSQNRDNIGYLDVINSTVSSNTAGVAGSSEYSLGGGIFSTGALRVSHSTISGNHGNCGCGSAWGGVYNQFGSPFEMDHTIIAENVPDDLNGELSSSAFNLIGNSSGGSGYGPTDLLDVNPLLGPLANNGGPTFTMALLPGSPAIDAGDPNPADPPEWDQRGPGFPRIVNGRIDIGAFEVQATGAPSPVSPLAFLLTSDFDSLRLKVQR
jgi:hypothetical protein